MCMREWVAMCARGLVSTFVRGALEGGISRPAVGGLSVREEGWVVNVSTRCWGVGREGGRVGGQ